MNSSWDGTYSSKGEAERSWTEQVPAESLAWIALTRVGPNAPIIDVGGGASRLVDELLTRGHGDVTVLDIAGSAVAEAQQRVNTEFGADDRAHWLVADVREWEPTRGYAVWHDRAVFHFLTLPDDQAAYVRATERAVIPGGHLIIATFAPSGPESCSGHSVTRWSAAQLHERFSESFTFVDAHERFHTTPWGAHQPFTWLCLRRR